MSKTFKKVALKQLDELKSILNKHGYKMGANPKDKTVYIKDKDGNKFSLDNLPEEFGFQLESTKMTKLADGGEMEDGWVKVEEYVSPKPAARSPRSPKRKSPKRKSPKRRSRSPKRVTRTKTETGSVYSSSTLRTWDAPQIASFLMNEAESYEAVLECVLREVQQKEGTEAKAVAESIKKIIGSIGVGPDLGVASKGEIDEDEEEYEEEFQVTRTSPKQRSPSPKKSEGDKDKFEELMEKYHKKAKEKKPTASLVDKLTRMAEKLRIDEETLEDEYDFYGFGRASRKSNRRKFSRRKGKRRVGKKVRRKSALRKTRKFSKAKKVYHRPRKALRSRTFGSPFAAGSSGSIYGLQDGPVWPGVFPMGLNVRGAGANILNVERGYRLFGAKSRTRKRRYSGKKLKPRRMKFKSGQKVRKRRSYGVFKPPSPLTIV